MSDVQSISIISTKQVDDPKPHIVYVIQVSTPTRTWTVDRRYNDFVALHAELKSSTGKEPPTPLPPKHWGLGSLRGGLSDDKIRERRPLLEQYLRSILTTKSPLWRQAYTFSDFLALPTSSSSAHHSSAPAPGSFTAQSWLLEHQALTALLRSARSSLLKRDALAGMSNPSGARSAGVEAKKVLKEVDGRLDVLEKGLKELKGIGEGEKRRREEMAGGLRVEKDGLVRMAEAGVRVTGSSSSASNSASGGFSGAGAGSSPWAPASGTMPGALPAAQTGRVFGSRAPAVETAATRPLDDRQLLQMQSNTMATQDQQLEGLSKLLRTQHEMGVEIHREIESQNELLDGIEQGVDRTGRKLGRAKREINKLG
ncbi:hypothetical protein IAT38_002456 [Cryptococcus sp. DSM 104549]